MVGKTLNDLVRRLDELNCKPKMTHDGVNSCCPAHDDKNPSFSAKMAADGKLLIKCHAGCSSEEVVRSLGWEMRDLFPVTSRRRQKSVGKTPEDCIAKYPFTREHGQPTIWWYHNRDGKKFSACVRWDKADGGKVYRPLTKRSDSGWEWKAKSDQRPLYDIHKLILLEKDELIFFVEGEKSAEAAKHLNLFGTTTQQGSNSPRKTDFQVLEGRTVIILPDNDEAGRDYTKKVSKLCFGAGSKEVRVVDLSKFFHELGEGGDIADLVAARKKDSEEILSLREQLLELAENAESLDRQPKADMLDANARKKQGHSPVDLKKKSTLNDVGTARSIVAEYGDSIVWNQDTAKWMTYDNGRWNSRRGDEQMHRYIKELAEKLCIDSRLLGDECCEGAEKFTLSLCNQRTIDRIAKCCRSEPGLQVSLSQFDQHPYLLNLANGTLELKPDDQGSFHLRKHRREDFLTQISPTKYDPTARSELWEKTVGEIFADDPESLEYIQRLAGVCLTGDVSDELFHIALGSGANGKTLFFEALRNMLGDDYARPCPQNFFSVRYAEASPLELHSVRGTRLSIASENVGDKGIQENLIKSLTGGDSMATRGLYQDYTTCIPSSKFIMLVNEVPGIRGADFGITRRLRVMSFTRNFEIDGTRNHKLKPIFTQSNEHSSGILNWCLDGLARWWEGRLLDPPKTVLDATAGLLKEEENYYEAFISDMCVISDHEHVETDHLFRALKNYIETHDCKIKIPVTKNALTRELKALGVSVERHTSGINRNKRFYYGIGIRRVFEEREDSLVGKKQESRQRGLVLEGDAGVNISRASI